ncbi:hypothetical protein JG687_00015338 [Phytophthora cactorum]|uniref:Uncharacterized protein n=1 Tax=Phytophthora cactorum TaxID=29920 RepID=A0A8T1TX51_9STRA|nr:hypothetical protein JG687_00015338 [Phytophthora cactorum]
MSYPILLNINNQVAQHQFRYQFSQPIDFSQYEVALGSISIFYSWQAINTQRNNGTFKIIWPTAATTTTYTITLPNGTYTASDINAYLQYWSIQNKLYLINNTTGDYYYLISVAENPSAYAIQFNFKSVSPLSEYTAATGFPTMPATAYTPQLQIIDTGTNSFGSTIGFSLGVYPSTQTTTAYSTNSNLVPLLDPVAAILVGLSNLDNPLSQNNQIFHNFTSADVAYGSLITTSQGQGIAYTPMQGSNNEIMLSFYDQNGLPLQIIDSNVCIRLLMRPKKPGSSN